MPVRRFGVRISATSCLVAAVLGLARAQDPAPERSAVDAGVESEPRARAERPVTIRFEGFLPGSADPQLEGLFQVEFRIYRSPQGGDAVWRETREVVAHHGRIDLQLGEIHPVPWEIHEATFKFLGASVAGAPEVYPRYAIVNVVYVSAAEALTAAAQEGGGAPSPAEYVRPAVRLDREARAAADWRSALRAARAEGAELPDYEDWYHAFAAAEFGAPEDWTGHYEWVLPWVYDPISHGRYSRFFRGRFQGCDYMDLSPSRSYVFRVSRPGASAAKSHAPEGEESDASRR